MDFDEAIRAHEVLGLQLAAYLRSADGSLKSFDLRRDKSCRLGKWLRGEGRRLAEIPEFQRLVAEHVRFHLAAGTLVDRINMGSSITEDAALGPKSEFGASSASVLALIVEMKRLAPNRQEVAGSPREERRRRGPLREHFLRTLRRAD